MMTDEIERLKAENAKLKEHVRWLKKGDVLHVLTDQELADQLKHEREMRASITALDDENVKLRELVKLYAKAIEEDGCHWCPHYEDVACDPETVPMRGGCGCMLWEELRELGVTDD